jgi:curved DNA-binding protein CbpA
VLELPESATPAEIRKSYLLLSRKYHPDKNNNNAAFTAKFQSISAAYAFLQ